MLGRMHSKNLPNKKNIVLVWKKNLDFLTNNWCKNRTQLDRRFFVLIWIIYFGKKKQNLKYRTFFSKINFKIRENNKRIECFYKVLNFTNTFT